MEKLSGKCKISTSTFFKLHILFCKFHELLESVLYVIYVDETIWWILNYNFRYFEGPTPVLVTADVDILQEVFVKQFKSFHARKVRTLFLYFKI